MKTLLERMFSYEYFGVILLCVIAVLTLLFIILFALAIKDSKKTKQAKNILKEANNNNKVEEVAFKEEVEEPEDVNIPINDDNVKIEKQDDIKDETLEATLFDFDSEIELGDVNTTSSITNIEQEQSDLQSIAMSLAKGYQKEKIKKDEPIVSKKEEVKKDINKTIDLSSIADIPKPQAVKVVGEEKIIDSKNSRTHRSLDDLVGEEYKLK